MLHPDQVTDRIADVGAVVAGSSAVLTWVGILTDVAQLIVALIGIAAGIASTWYYVYRTVSLMRDRRAASRR